MATVSDYIQASLRLAEILGENDSVSAEQGAAGIVVMNDMIGALRGKGIEIGLSPQSSTTATLLIPEEDRLGFKYLFAAYLCMDYGRAPSNHVAGIADDNYSRMLRRAVIEDKVENNPAIPLGEGQGIGFNITTGV